MLTIDAIKTAVAPICREYNIDRLFLFGSYARGEADSDSDIDFRVDRGNLTGFAFGGFYGAIQDSLNLPVDLLTTEQLKSDFLHHIKNEEVMIYERNS